jgi:hypothetical protein
VVRRERGGVREQSHKEEMSAAIRGDFARLRDRRGQERTTSPPARPERIVSTPPPRAQPSPTVAAVPAAAPAEAPPPATPTGSSRRSLLRSLLGRRR